ncbi:MAG: hypothetical protein Q7S95_00015 [bacterium]|nr:hypothetical protein [bacterium]
MPPQIASLSPRRLSLEQGTILALVATITLAAIIVIPSAAFPFVPTKAFVLASGTVVTLALYILARLARGNIILPPVLLLLALWLPTLAYLLGAAFGEGSFSAAFWGSTLQIDSLGFMLSCSALGTLAALAVRRPEHYRSFVRAGVTVFGLVIVISVCVIVVGQFAPGLVSPAFAVIGSGTDLAAVLGLAVVLILLAVRFLELSLRTGRILLVGGVLALALLAILNSSLIWIILALVALGLFVEAIMTRRPQVIAEVDFEDTALLIEGVPTDAGSRSFLVPLVVLAISLFFLIGGTLGNALANVLNVGTLNVRPSWQATLSVGNQVYAHSPVFGSGPGTFGVEWLKYRDASLNVTPFWNIDFPSGIGFIPTSFVTTGLLGGLAWLALIALLLVWGGRMLILRTPEDRDVQYVSVASFLSACFLLTVAIVDVPGPVILALAFISLGIFASTMRYARGGRQWGVIFAQAPRLGFVIVFALTLLLLASVAAAYTLIGQYIAVAELSRATAAYSAGNLDAAGSAVGRSLSFAPLPENYQLEAFIADARLGEILSSTTLAPAQAQQAFQDTLSNGINAALTATRLSPNSYQNWIALGNLYGAAVPLGVSGAYDSAKSAYGRAVALNPTSPQLQYLLAELNVAQKDTKAAEADLKQAIALKPDYTQAIFLLSQLEVADGNVKGALVSAEAAAYFTPNNPNILFQVGILRAASGDLSGSVAALTGAVAANTSFANARYFLAAVYAKQKNYQDALTQIRAVASLSADNAAAVAGIQKALAAGKDPFPPNLLSVSPAPVSE